MKIGALWPQKSKKDGKEFYSGVIEFPGTKMRIAIFPNTEKKDGDKQPSHNIIWSPEQEQPKYSSQGDSGYSGSDGGFDDDNPL